LTGTVTLLEEALAREQKVIDRGGSGGIGGEKKQGSRGIDENGAITEQCIGEREGGVANKDYREKGKSKRDSNAK
jgi:hypothetical protein